MGSATGIEIGERPDLVLAREAFLDDVPVPPGVVRSPILASWTRSRSWGVDPENLELATEPGVELDTILRRAATPVLQNMADLFATEPVSVILCDAGGVVLDRLTGDASLEQHLNCVWLAPGFSYAERFVGTNGIGTALEGRGPAQVFGHEHFIERLERLACAGAPIRHPVSGKVLGVIDLTCWRKDAGPLLLATAATLTDRIERALLQHVGRRERAVLDDYLVACRRNRGAVLAVADDLLMMNDRARELLDAADQGAVLAAAGEALSTGRWHRIVIDLSGSRTARVTCRPTVSDVGVAGGVILVQVAASASVPVLRRSRVPAVALTSAVGTGATWTTCCEAVDRNLRAREWLVLEGEAGAGKQTIVRATHESRTPAARLHVLDAGESGPGWAAEVEQELAAGSGTIVLTHLERLAPAALDELADVLEPYRESTAADRPWVVATVTTPGSEPGPELSRVLACFPSTVRVPPLRQHVEDVALLVPHLLSRLIRGGSLTCPPDVMRVLVHNRWPGNVEQLYQVLRKVVARRRSGTIELRDLPPECRATTRRVLSPLEAMECDAIVDALFDAQGNKVEAARRLAMSRATIYRKIRDYGIAVTPRADPVPGR